MKSNKFFYHWGYYSRSQRIGLLLFVFLVLFIQVVVYFVYHRPSSVENNWMLLSKEKNLLFEQKLDSIRTLEQIKKDTIYPFNPNFITDFKGYSLGMTVEQIDRLLDFRKQNKYVNSVLEFQSVTLVSDDWIEKYSPYFKFPDWVVEKQKRELNKDKENYGSIYSVVEQKREVKDINGVTAEELQAIRGIGPAYSKRIIEDRNKLGGYVHMDQVKFVYGLPDEVVTSLLKYYAVKSSPAIVKVNINHAGINELKNVPYLNYYTAREIVKYRSSNGDFTSVEQLKEIANFPLDKINIISLYLDFTK